MSRINETLKQKIDELDLDRRLNDLVARSEESVRKGLEKAGTYAHEHRDDIDARLDSLSDNLDARTQGKYADKVDSLRRQLDTGLDRLAERRGDGTDQPDQADPPGPPA